MTGNRLIDAIEAKGYSLLDTYTVADAIFETILHVRLNDTDEEIGEYDTDDGTWIDENYEPEDDDYGYEMNMPCDNYGPVACSYSCPMYLKCQGK